MDSFELICPAGNPAALRAAVDAGADAVYLGFRDETNARNFPGLNFSREDLAGAVAYAHARGVQVFVAINTYPQAGNLGPWERAADDAARLKADAVILADVGLLAYAARRHPDLRLHLSVQASAANVEAIRLYRDAFGVRRVVLPRVLTVPEIARLNAEIDIETEVFVFGGMCPMAEGRCSLSSYATGLSPNRQGVCSPASHVRYEPRGAALASTLGGFTINLFGEGEQAGYPTLCKGRFLSGDRPAYLFEEPTSLNALELLPELKAAKVRALKIEGRQRGKAYIAAVVAAYRKALDAFAKGQALPMLNLDAVVEGGAQTTGAFKRAWR
ncbi:ubiquinone anaerobic biosynthesis protein UbiU [Azospirillum rugosum]|uniref:Ubiquinone biosynthesis protein UbiU n=1 Tax=Azospirillum rugosum TaxID=416170 RepID=A0ABS4SR82_9PROT|nr:peptidase U32 family protein [Azospirillum rugosum]MBP2295083.1 putative protease [Azospirillum rugosum]MDQ0528906.1 putative protease [Azospirillum rugosum]